MILERRDVGARPRVETVKPRRLGSVERVVEPVRFLPVRVLGAVSADTRTARIVSHVGVAGGSLADARRRATVVGLAHDGRVVEGQRMQAVGAAAAVALLRKNEVSHAKVVSEALGGVSPRAGTGCKERPRGPSRGSGGGVSRSFVPWCR